MSELKLLPCPFCGGEAELIDTFHGTRILPRPIEDIHRFHVYCPNCGSAFESQETKTGVRIGWKTPEEAIAAWNRRAQPENSRQHALQTGVCPMCEDCPDGCPVETPNDSRNRPENEPLTLEELREELERLEELATATNGDVEETYTNGYRWGHRNGQIELLRRILNIGDGTCESECHKPERSEAP